MSAQPSNTKPATEAPVVPPATTAAKSGVTRKRRPRVTMVLAIAVAIVGVAIALARMRQLTSDNATGMATPMQQASADRDSASQPTVTARASEPTGSAAANARAAAPQTAIAVPKKKPSTPTRSVAPLRSAPAVAAESHDAEESTSKAAEIDNSGAAAPAAPATETAGLSTVTITGCLEVSTSEDRFRLTDTDSIEAPKTRSWRTAFLKKRSGAVVLAGSLDTAAMDRQVGKRVAATGVLANRELKVSSVRVVASSCE